jgi:hypothetical protein
MKRRWAWAVITGVTLLGILTLVFVQNARMSSTPQLANPNFEANADGTPLNGWTTTGTIETAFPYGKAAFDSSGWERTDRIDSDSE